MKTKTNNYMEFVIKKLHGINLEFFLILGYIFALYLGHSNLLFESNQSQPYLIVMAKYEPFWSLNGFSYAQSKPGVFHQKKKVSRRSNDNRTNVIRLDGSFNGTMQFGLVLWMAN